MTALAELLSGPVRARLAERLRDLDGLDALIREPGHQQPPAPPGSLQAIAARRTCGHTDTAVREHRTTKP